MEKEQIVNKIIFNIEKSLFRYELFILMGLIMTIGTLLKLLGHYDFSSDWFWFVAGVGLTVEAGVALFKQRKFDNKYTVIQKGSLQEKLLKDHGY